MDRPLSAASSTTAPSTTSAPSHKRNASVKNGTRPTVSTVISLFTTNLRLLNLDLLPDWPSIGASSFSNQDARTRIKSTEYALYHLCRLHDPASTADKLQPFFPPLEPLQSVNLRAAIYRFLNELKKNGVLSRDTVLRKTMLDDCQGEKFWEVCLAFSAIVLRKITLERRSKYGRPLAERLGVAQGVSKSQKESMLPLAIAHRVALSKILKEKQRKDETFARLYDLLAEKEDGLRQRKVRSQEQAQRLKTLQPGRLNSVEKAIQKTWVGSSELKDALVDGDTCAAGDGMLVTSFDRIWQDNNNGNIRRESTGAEVGLLQNFGNRAAEQTTRLRRWQNYHDKLMASKPASARSSRQIAQKPVIHFDRHQSLSLRDPSPDDDEPSPPPRRAKQTSAVRYDEILAAMRHALRKNSAQRNTSAPPQPQVQPLRRSQTQPVPMRKPSLAIDVSPGAQDPHRRSPSQTAVPVRPRMGRRVPSQSRLYEKPKVESQREPIPLKAELFSPLKDKRRSSGVSPIFATSILPSPAEEGDSPGTKITGPAVRDKTDVPSPHGGDNGLKIRFAHQDSERKLNGARSPTTPNKNTEAVSVSTTDFKIPALPTKDQAVGGAVARPSLAERTRMSIAFNSAEDINGLTSESTTPDSDSAETPDDIPVISEPHQMFDRRASLLDRTRQSISMAPPPQQIPKSRKSHHRSRTSVYPINQFETPKQDRRSTISVEEVAKRDATPIEQLLSPDAEYDSVFKSRPKIALSPVLSPYRDAEVNGKGGLDSDAGRSSPLVGVGGSE